LNRWIICFGVVLLSGAALAQQPQPPDAAHLMLKVEDLAQLLDARERQVVAMQQQAAADKAWWAAYVAGLKQ
jgi:hypothetical protein